MKTAICLVLAFALTLCAGCALIGEEEPVTDGGGQGGTQTPATDADRLTYYENLVTQLQAELLAVKAEMQAAKTEYENRIDQLESETSTIPEACAFTYSVSGDGVTITAYTGKDVNVQIPSQIDGRAVTAIADKAFLNHSTVQSIVVPEGVRTVGWFAFSGCVSLGAVSLPASVETISYGAFENCNRALTVFCRTGSYAEQYARSYGIATAS